jgi:hypothetical protein
MAWNSPWLPVAGTPITADVLRAVLASLEDKFDHGIEGSDLELTGNVFQVDADLDLLGHDLLHAANVPTGIVNVTSLGVKGDGSDDTDRIQQAIQTIANDGHGIAFFPQGTYLINDSVYLRSNMSIFGAGASTVFKLGGANTETMSGIVTKGKATIRDIAFTTGATDVGLIARSAIQVEGTGDVTIDNVYAYKVASVVSGGGLSSLTITDCIADHCQDGIRVSSQANLNISGLLCDTSYGTGIYLTECSNFRISGVGVNNSGSIGIFLNNCSNGSVTAGCLRAIGSGFKLSGCVSVSLIGCHAVDSAYGTSGAHFPGILLDSCSGCVVTASHSYITAENACSQTYCLHVNGGTNNAVFGNVLEPTSVGTGLTSGSDGCFRNDSTGLLEYGNYPVRL